MLHIDLPEKNWYTLYWLVPVDSQFTSKQLERVNIEIAKMCRFTGKRSIYGNKR